MNAITKEARAKEVERLREIQEEIEELTTEAKRCMRDAGALPGVLARAESYWIPHIIGALRNDHGYLSGSMHTMQDTIEDLESDEEDDR